MILDRKTAPEHFAAASIPVMNYSPVYFTNQLPYYLVEGGTEDIVKIDMVFKAGTRFEQKPLLATLCLNMLKEGTENYTAQEIAETTDFYGAQIAVSLSKDRAEVTLLCQGKHLDKLIDIFTDVFLLPTFPNDELTQYKKRSSSALAVNLGKVEFKCRLLFSKLMFSETAYQEKYDLKDYAAITCEDLSTYFSNNFDLNDAFCLISGKHTGQVAKKLGAVIAQKAAIKVRQPVLIEPLKWTYTKGEQWTKKDGAVQTAIRLGAPALSRKHGDYTALYIANVALGGYFGSRLMQNIREEKGYTYGIGSGINALEEAAYLSISTQVGADFTNATITEIKKELHEIASEPLGDEEFELIQNYVAGNLLKRFDGPFATADRVKAVLSNDLPADWYTRFSKEIFELSPDDICAVSKQYLNPDLFTIAVVGEWPEE